MKNYLVLPMASDIRAARASLDWKQMTLAYKCGVSSVTITAIENDTTKPRRALIERIAEVFAEEGIYFLPGGGFKVNKSLITIHEGIDCYLKVLDDMLKVCIANKEEVLLLGSDDRRSNSDVINKKKELYEAGIQFKHLISSKNNYILGPLEDYRKVDKDSFFSSDAVTIYKNKVMFFLKKGSNTVYVEDVKNLLITDNELAETFREYFYRLWDDAEKVTKSSVKQIIFKKNEK